MRVALMVEGQEGVSWDEWLALADACEEHGIEALFRSDHYLSPTAPDERAATDAWTLLGALAARTEKLVPAARFADEYNTYGVDSGEAARRPQTAR